MSFSQTLRVEGVSRVFVAQDGTRFRAVDDVSFAVSQGECLGIVGESGSGKSTLARMILRLVDVTEGALEFEGRDITRAKGKELRAVYRDLQAVFQNPAQSFDPRRSLGFGIAEGLRNRGASKRDARKRVEELLRQCGLPAEFACRYPHEVSGGQCQRVAIARALAAGPKLLICDEATSALDVTVQRQIVELLSRLQRQKGMALIFISHDIALVSQICERMLVMKDGRIIEQGATGEVLSHPQHAYTRALIDAVL